MIYLDDAINAVKAGSFSAATLFGRTSGGMAALEETVRLIKDLPPAQPEIIRCKDCKHKPHVSDKYDYDNRGCGFEIIFPDYRCPCRCDDEYYNHIPDDDWYCGNAERREE